MGEYIKEKIPRAHTLEEEKRKLDEEEEKEREACMQYARLKKDYLSTLQLKLEDIKTYFSSKEYLIVSFKGELSYYERQIQVFYEIKKVLLDKGYEVLLTADIRLDDAEKRCLYFFLKIFWGSLKDPKNRNYKPQIVCDEILDDFLSFIGKGEIPQKYTFKKSDYNIESDNSVIPIFSVIHQLGFILNSNDITKRNFIGLKKVVDKEYHMLYIGK